MGEAIITSRSGSTQDQIPVISGYHSILVTLRDYRGELLRNFPITCRDGNQTYNYITNESGKSLFTCNSGKAKFSIYNGNFRESNNGKYIDFNSFSKSVDAPIGATTRLNINIPKRLVNFFGVISGSEQGGGGYVGNRFGNNIYLKVLCDLQCNVYCIGGGGGGAGYSYNTTGTKRGSTGGAGGYVSISQYNFKSGVTYHAITGNGGTGGSSNKNGNSGEPTYFPNISEIKAGNGGGGGIALSSGQVPNGGGKGGWIDNNGGDADNLFEKFMELNNRTNLSSGYGDDTLTYKYGGGGAGAVPETGYRKWGGKYCGGGHFSSYNINNYNQFVCGKRRGGGGGAGAFMQNYTGGAGGCGGLAIEFINY